LKVGGAEDGRAEEKVSEFHEMLFVSNNL
jgi:hypothetical protein